MNGLFPGSPALTWCSVLDHRVGSPATVGVTVELVNWVCSFGSDAEALKPVDLRSRVAESLSKAASYYDDEA